MNEAFGFLFIRLLASVRNPITHLKQHIYISMESPILILQRTPKCRFHSLVIQSLRGHRPVPGIL